MPVASSASLTTNSAGDEHHGRVAEAGQRLVEVEHAGRPQRQGRADRHDLHRDPVRDEQHHDRAEHEEDDGAVGHTSTVREVDGG